MKQMVLLARGGLVLAKRLHEDPEFAARVAALGLPFPGDVAPAIIQMNEALTGFAHPLFTSNHANVRWTASSAVSTIDDSMPRARVDDGP